MSSRAKWSASSAATARAKARCSKILSQITEPTEGRVELNGRVGSLLEVGTGFHPDLTGRENVYLNGAILGMSRRDIARRFDEIVAFAEIEKFLDTQVKRYSSGMYMRLAFAVAAHLEPEILIIDEVLAVGDAAFQKKCLGKMSDVAHHGRTVLFVSHNMAAVQNLCTRCLLLDQGVDRGRHRSRHRHLQISGKQLNQSGGIPVGQRTDRRGSGQARLVEIRLLNDEGQTGIDRCRWAPIGTSNSPIDCATEIPQPELRLFVTSSQGQRISRISSWQFAGRVAGFSGLVKLNCRISQMNLLPGLYYLSVRIASQLGDTIDYRRIGPANRSCRRRPAWHGPSGRCAAMRHVTSRPRGAWTASNDPQTAPHAPPPPSTTPPRRDRFHARKRSAA